MTIMILPPLPRRISRARTRAQRHIFIQDRLHMLCRFFGGPVAKRTGFELTQHLKPVDGPCFELLEGYVCGWGERVEVQSVWIGLITPLWCGELLFSVIEQAAL